MRSMEGEKIPSCVHFPQWLWIPSVIRYEVISLGIKLEITVSYMTISFMSDEQDKERTMEMSVYSTVSK